MNDALPVLNGENHEKAPLASDVVSVQNPNYDADWANEFADLTYEDMENLERKQKEEAAAAAVTSETKASSYKDDFWKELESEWQEAQRNERNYNAWLHEYSQSYDEFETYSFREENPMADHPNPLEEGRRKLAAGDIPSAVLLFEAAVQREPENQEGWKLLGLTQAKNEQDPSAVAALRKATELDPTDCESIMALAVSYTNESYQAQACHSLRSM